MVDTNLVAQKLKELSLRIAKVQAQCPAAAAELAADGDLLDLVSFNLFLAVQACIDLATHLIADESWEPAAATAGLADLSRYAAEVSTWVEGRIAAED